VTTTSWLRQNWRSQLVMLLAVVATVGGYGERTLAQIVPDATLGAENSVVTPNINVNNLPSARIDGGAIRGANLFHSFEQFNIGAGQAAYFTNPAGIERILTRVTGSDRSEIFGTLGVLGNADLFFLNPNGIIFGANARLNVGGSFLASTANRLNFADGTQFDAPNSQTTPILTVTAPIGLQFERATAAEIVVEGPIQPLTRVLQSLPPVLGSPINSTAAAKQVVSDLLRRPQGLQVLPGKTLALVGGNVSLEGGSLTAVGGRVELGSVVGEAEIGLTPIDKGYALGYEEVDSLATSTQRYGDIQLSQLAFVNASDVGGTGGGDIQVRGDRIELFDESAIFAGSLTPQGSGDIYIKAQQLNVENGSIIGTGAFGVGNSGDVTIETDRLTLRDSAVIETLSVDRGNAGNLAIKATSSINVVDNGFIATGSLGTGDGAQLSIDTQRLSIRNGGEVLNSANEGRGGSLTINASKSVEVVDFDSAIYTDTFGNAPAGDLRIVTAQLTISNGAQVSAATLSQGQGGDLFVTASEFVNLSGTSADGRFPSGLYTSSGLAGFDDFQPTGAGGDLTLVTGRLSVQNEASISASTVGSGNGGKIDLQANELFLTNGAAIDSFSLGTGNAGNIFVSVANLLQANNSDIFATASQSQGGNINLNAKTIELLGDSDLRTDVSSGANNGGSITLRADSIIAFDDSDIIAAARDGRGGNIMLDTPALFGLSGFTTDTNLETLDGNNRVDINASGQLASGTITIPDVSFLQNNLTELPSDPIDTNTLLANSCITPSDRQQGSFMITGAGSLPLRPGDASTLPYPTGSVRPVPPDTTSHDRTSDPIVEPHGVYRLAGGQIVLSRECP
jgi:filamentous hemagglutinin family protein